LSADYRWRGVAVRAPDVLVFSEPGGALSFFLVVTIAVATRRCAATAGSAGAWLAATASHAWTATADTAAWW
jgi:hypothetical protein